MSKDGFAASKLRGRNRLGIFGMGYWINTWG
jgi:hypothetical protein